MPAPPCPSGECPQCWHHAHVLHVGNWFGFLLDPECPGCANHMLNGCPKATPKVTPKKKWSWW